MRTFSESDDDSGSMSVISLPDTESDDFEIILMPSLSPSSTSNVVSLAASLESLGLSSSSPGGSSGRSVPGEEGAVGDATPHPAARPSTSYAGAEGGARETSPIAVYDGECDSANDGRTISSAHTHRASATPSRPTHTPSILSASDARESIDSFLTDPEFTSDRANKLRLWQALCIELGLVELEEADDGTSARSASPDSSSSSDGDATPTASRSATPTQTLPALPTSLKAADRLLNARAHVNILEYLNARNDPARHGEDKVGKYADLVYPSASSLLRAMRRDRKYAPIGDVKREWLQPLLKDFGFRRRREGRL